MEIKFGDLLFTIDKENRLLLSECFFIKNGASQSTLQMTPVYDTAGGSTSGMLNLCSSLATASLRYLSHNIEDNVLTIIQQNELVETRSTYHRYDDTNAIAVTQTVKNIGKEPLLLDLLQTFNLRFGKSVSESPDYLLHRFTNHRYTESLPVVSSLRDLGLAWRNAAFRYLNQGNASSVEYVPEGILENKKTGDHLMFGIESYASWYCELTTSTEDCFTLAVGGANARYHGASHMLAPGESYTSVPVTICAAKSLNGVLAEMTRYRRHLKPVCHADASLPVVYNEYMHFSWDDPNEERAIANAPAVAAAGAKYYIIDCGWHNARAADSTPVMYKLFGTWYEDRGRFPHGIKYVSDYMHSLGMGFGLWLAPEVVGKENHEMLAYYEDECFIRKNGFKVANDTGYLLDFRHPKVVDYMTKTIDRMVNEYGCDYIKFDGCPNPGMHAEIDDAYAAFTDWSLSMTHRHPNVIFEDCAGGGQRTDYKALSIFHLLSTSDQTNYLHYPYITANIMVSALPEQAGVWSYPVDVDLFDPAKPQNTNERITKERVVLNMVNALLCRIHLASRLFLLDEEKLALIREGVTFYETIIEAKKKAVPYLPLGYAKFGDTLVSVGIKAEDKLYLAVWNLGGNQDVTLPLPEIKVKNATVAYPISLPTDFTYTQDSITVRFTENVQARIFEITLA